MKKELVWLHEKALVFNHNILNSDRKKIYIWDDEYFKKRNYSLKKLVFIYETLCEMDIDIVYGNSLDIIKSFQPDNVFTIHTVDSEIKKLFSEISQLCELIVLGNKNFIDFKENNNITRFFQYWNKAKKKVFDVGNIK